MSKFLRLWPFGLFVLMCLTIACYLNYLLEFAPSFQTAILFGVSTGGLSVLAVVAGLCGRSFIRGIAVASLLAAAAFVTTLTSDYLHKLNTHPTELPAYELRYLIGQATHTFNVPVFVLALSAPMAIVRWKIRHYLSFDESKPKPPVGMETLLLWTTVSACLLYYCRVPMEIHSFGFAALAIYLPGLMAVSAAACAVVALPSVRWPFLQQQRWWHWPATTATAVAGTMLLCILFNLVLSQWTRGAFRSFQEVAVVCITATSLYLLGLLSLRLSGFRWVPNAPMSDAYRLGLSNQDRWIGRRWTAAFVGVAILTTFTVAQNQKFEAETQTRLGDLSKKMVGRGEAIMAMEQEIVGACLDSLSEDRVSIEVLESRELRTLCLSGSSITNEDLALLKRWPNLSHLDLSYTPIDDEALEYISGLRLFSLNLSQTRVTANGLAKLLDEIPSISTLTLRGMQLSDDELKLIYRPGIRSWDLSDNNLTDAGVKSLWEDDGVFVLNLSANPITLATFDSTTRAGQIALIADDSPLDDATAGKLVAAGIVSSITLGKTKITPLGLSGLMTSGIRIELRSGSFTEEDLVSIDPTCSHLSIVNCDLTGDFLTRWTKPPVTLLMRGTRVSDQQILAWSKLDWQPMGLAFLNEGLTDRSIPAIRKLAPTSSLVIAGSDITATGLRELGLTDLELVIAYLDFTAEEIRSLKKIYPKLHVRANLIPLSPHD
jgi:Leucine Rich repeat